MCDTHIQAINQCPACGDTITKKPSYRSGCCSFNCHKNYTGQVSECSFVWFKCLHCDSLTLKIFKGIADTKATQVKFCSAKCKSKHNVQKAIQAKRGKPRIRPKQMMLCKGCKLMKPRPNYGTNDYCSRECCFEQKYRLKHEKRLLKQIAAAWRESIKQRERELAKQEKAMRGCLVCGGDTKGRVGFGGCCSAHCRRIHTNKPTDCAFVWFRCARCQKQTLKIFKSGVDVTGESNRFCSKKCLNNSRCKSSGDKVRRERIRRQRKGKLPTRLQVYNKTEGKCGICHKHIDLSLNFPHHNSFTVDHIIPIAKGGDHSFDNMQPAHMICNSTKRDL